MAQRATIPESTIATAVLKWQVVETTSIGTRWVVAAFDLPEDAVKFAQTPGRRFEIRVDPNWPDARELRRALGVTETIEAVES